MVACMSSFPMATRLGVPVSGPAVDARFGLKRNIIQSLMQTKYPSYELGVRLRVTVNVPITVTITITITVSVTVAIAVMQLEAR